MNWQQQQQQQQGVWGGFYYQPMMPVVESKPVVKVPMNVFVGKLPLEVADSFVEKLLNECGRVLKWKRTMDSETNKPKGFGFCTFESAQGATSAVRLLNDFPILNSRILVKVGKKEQAIVDAISPEGPLSPDEQKAMERIQAVVRSTDPQAKADPIQKDIEDFRSKQAQRDKALEDERRRKLQAKIETMKPPAAKKAKVEIEEAPEPTPLAAGAKLGFGLKGPSKKKIPASSSPIFAVEEDAKPRQLQTLEYDDEEDAEEDRAIAEQIPTESEALFALPVDWGEVETATIVRTKLRPLIAKKIGEYLGQEEATLIDFVATQLENRATPSAIADELALVLEDDAYEKRQQQEEEGEEGEQQQQQEG
ncbi:hypothetical protein CTAYLR_003754 [Chrysophaeum taylorii]|uniref:RRM domain-containing protein n=1 Tax=Chrysophaeum taylorii TaxID=2483200 RepID=A0AAD7XNW1_9STRA|nr:hypothetical protein CTAYLR_003754 [Chrysophaeum taylorii]